MPKRRPVAPTPAPAPAPVPTSPPVYVGYVPVGANAPHSIQRSGTAERFELRPGERASFDGPDVERCQLDAYPSAPQFQAGSDIVRTFGVRFERRVPGDAPWMIVAEWHHLARTGNAPLALTWQIFGTGKVLMAVVFRDGVRTEFPVLSSVDPARTYHFREEVRFHPTAGLYRLELDGIEKAKATGKIGYTSLLHYPEHGIYRGSASDTAVVVFDPAPRVWIKPPLVA